MSVSYVLSGCWCCVRCLNCAWYVRACVPVQCNASISRTMQSVDLRSWCMKWKFQLSECSGSKIFGRQIEIARNLQFLNKCTLFRVSARAARALSTILLGAGTTSLLDVSLCMCVKFTGLDVFFPRFARCACIGVCTRNERHWYMYTFIISVCFLWVYMRGLVNVLSSYICVL